MTITEFSDQFDVLYNNIMSNAAPGLNEYEKSVFLTKAQNEIVKNYFSSTSKGNTLAQGFDDSAKRQADFSALMKTAKCTVYTGNDKEAIDARSTVYQYPPDVFIVINETLTNDKNRILQVIPLRYDEYVRLMSKPFKRPLKNQAWRLINSGTVSDSIGSKFVEIVVGPTDTVTADSYKVRYVKKPKPIIVGDLDGLSIDNFKFTDQTYPTNAVETDGECELDPILHEDILQRAVELAKAAYATDQSGTAQLQNQITVGQRSE